MTATPTIHPNKTLHLQSVESLVSASSIKRLLANLAEYLEKLTGREVLLEPVQSSKLPLFLRERYTLRRAEIFGRDFLLALDSLGEEDPSAATYANFAELLASHLGHPPVLVLPALATHIRQGLIRLGRPFIVPGSQTFLPTALIDLRERQPAPRLPVPKSLSPAAQSALLYHLERETVHHQPLQKIAETIGYSPNMLAKVKHELEAAELCKTIRDGRVVLLRFRFERRELWEKALPWLTSPARATHWVRWENPPQGILLAGITALSGMTMIADDRVPVHALGHREHRAALENGEYRICADRDEATARLEVWNYNPKLLAIRPDTVDPLSLYLTLKDDPNERVQDQLETLIKQFPW
jgi:hypothetical protein